MICRHFSFPINIVGIFKIIASTGEYPFLTKEFTKIENEVSVYGYDLVTALNDVSFNSPSKKLSELLSGLSTSLTTGGSLQEFFKEKARDFLFEYRLKKEKEAKLMEFCKKKGEKGTRTYIPTSDRLISLERAKK